jgi:hypothetical protein
MEIDCDNENIEDIAFGASEERDEKGKKRAKKTNNP